MSTCLPCGVDLNCTFTDPLDLYALQGPAFGWVLNCPPGFDCGLATEVHVFCCGQELTAVFPRGATVAERTAIITDLLDKCELRQEFCGGGRNQPPQPPNRVRFYNRSITLLSQCAAPGEPSTGTYRFTVPAGMFLAATQEAADALARDYANTRLLETKFCVVPPALCPCAGSASTFTMRINGGIGPFSAQIASGRIPAGMALTTVAKSVKLSGTPVTPGQYSFSLRVVDENGGYWQNTLTVRVLQIGYSSTTSESMLIPAVNSSVIVGFNTVDNLEVGDVLRMASVNGSNYVTREAGTFEVLAIDSPDPRDVQLKNLTGTPGVTLSEGAIGYWVISDVPDYETGVPYDFQLPASGGSGSYSWRISSGSLPTGMEMTVGGHLVGTPTGVVDSNFTVEMIDNACQSVNRSFFRPIVTLVGRSETTTAIIEGFEEFWPYISTPPKKYMTRTWSTAMTGNDASGNPAFANEGVSIYLHGPINGQYASAMIRMYGSDQINATGQVIATATTQLYSSCPNSNVTPILLGNGGPVPGWCFQYDTAYSFSDRPVPTPATCGACAFPLLPDTSSVMSTIATLPTPTLYGSLNSATSSTHAGVVAEGELNLGFWLPAGPGYNPILLPFPPNLGFPFTTGDTALLAYKHSYSIDLATEYTDAMALANAEIYDSNSLVAVNQPRTTGFVSTWTTVEYDVKLRNLVFGEVYLVTVTLEPSAGSVTVRTYNFTATGTTHTITDTIPTPASGGTTTVRTPTAAYAF